eukprot:3426500-Alexandrium_andersonii.AAC.1
MQPHRPLGGDATTPPAGGDTATPPTGRRCSCTTTLRGAMQPHRPTGRDSLQRRPLSTICSRRS